MAKTQEAVSKWETVTRPKHQVIRTTCEQFPRSRTMTSHGSALTSLPYVHSQANLITIYFDHTNINLYDVLRIINSLASRSGQILNG